MTVVENGSSLGVSEEINDCKVVVTLLNGKKHEEYNKIRKSKTRIKYRSWVIVFAAFVSFSIKAGLLYTFSIYYVQFLLTFQESRSHTAWIGSLFTCLLQLTGPFSGLMIKAFGCRITIMLGGLGTAFGYIISSFAINVNYLLFSLGILTAIFLNFVYTGFAIALAVHCKKFHSLATGIAFSGIGFGIFVFSPLLELAVDYYGWRGSMFIQAGMALNFCVCGAFVSSKELPNYRETYVSQNQKDMTTKNFKNNNVNKGNVSFNGHSKYSKFISFFTDCTFICFILSNSIWVMGTSTIFVTYKDLANLFGYGDKFSIIISSMGIADIIGRLTVGVVLSKCKNYVITYSAIILFFSGLALCLHITISSFEMFLGLAIMFSFFYAKQCVICVVAPATMYGAENLTLTFGVLLFFGGCTTLFGPPLGGWLIDMTQDRSAILWFTSSTNFIAAVLMSFVILLQKKQNNNDICEML
ncbi:monocarboxylate transporter 12-like isoform X1 [Centruroides sculpturatus]|uniref:monocarboxylate transporter 12-like isoform X1 n=1 Tax=Centruroides sculpturatus TaxID=218467 RepID=UPI000C6ED190|nr:monocarboxylate transporter 12-like isoform X1 [Centruroides sculpturatus]